VSPFLIFILRKNMYGNKDKGTTDDSSIPVDIKLWKEALVEAMKWIMRGGVNWNICMSGSSGECTRGAATIEHVGEREL
jgi:hypothetical protein